VIQAIASAVLLSVKEATFIMPMAAKPSPAASAPTTFFGRGCSKDVGGTVGNRIM